MKTRNTEAPNPPSVKKTTVRKDVEKTPSKSQVTEKTKKVTEAKPSPASNTKTLKTPQQTTPKSGQKPALKEKVVVKTPAAAQNSVCKSTNVKPTASHVSQVCAAVKTKNTDSLNEVVNAKTKTRVMEHVVTNKNLQENDGAKKLYSDEGIEGVVKGKESDAEVEEYDEMDEYEGEEGFEDPVDEDIAEDYVSEEEQDDEFADERSEIAAAATERKLKKAQEIFVGGLDRNAMEEDVRRAFEKIGDVIEIRMHINSLTNKNKGFAFVKFANKEQAARALSELKSPFICGKKCGIAPSEDNDTLFLGNICNTWTKEAVKRKIEEYGIENVENVNLIRDNRNEGLSRGFAFVEFSCHEDAMMAYKRLQQPDVVFGHPERTAKVAFAEPIRAPDPEVMAKVKSVFVDGLPPYWDEDRVKEQFERYGEIEKVVLARNMATSKRKDFGFVTFVSRESALAFIKGVNNTELGDDGKTKLKAKARLANPLPKTQAVRGGMRGGFRIDHFGKGIYNRYGRLGRGGRSLDRVEFQRGMRTRPRGRGRGGRSGRFSYADHYHKEDPYPENHRNRYPRSRGGRRGSFKRSYDEYDEYDEAYVDHGTSGYVSRREGNGKSYYSKRPMCFEDAEYTGSSYRRGVDGDESYFDGGGRPLKRSYSTAVEDSGYIDLRRHPRYDHSDPISGDSRYRDSYRTDRVHSRDYYDTSYRSSGYSSAYSGARSDGYYY